MADCARKGVKGVVISSEGFAETGAQGGQYQEEVRTILRSTGIRGFGADTFRPLVEVIHERTPKPVFFSLLGSRENMEVCRSFLEEHRIPFYLFPEMAVRVLANMWRYARKVRREG